MFLLLTRSIRFRVGRLVALTYLFCVLAPAAAFAWGNGPAPCFVKAQTADLAPVHHQVAVSHMHDSGAMHDHAGVHSGHHTAAQEAPTKHHHDGKGTAGPCSAIMCVTALPPDIP